MVHLLKELLQMFILAEVSLQASLQGRRLPLELQQQALLLFLHDSSLLRREDMKTNRFLTRRFSAAPFSRRLGRALTFCCCSLRESCSDCKPCRDASKAATVRWDWTTKG